MPIAKRLLALILCSQGAGLVKVTTLAINAGIKTCLDALKSNSAVRSLEE
jgi:hypothetical protein